MPRPSWVEKSLAGLPLRVQSACHQLRNACTWSSKVRLPLFLSQAANVTDPNKENRDGNARKEYRRRCYEAHIRKADGTEVVVKVDANFSVTATEEGGGGRGGHRGDHGGPGGTPATLTGDVADKVTGAALAAVPGGTVVRARAGPDGVYHAHVHKSDGTAVIVTLDADFKVIAG